MSRLLLLPLCIRSKIFSIQSTCNSNESYSTCPQDLNRSAARVVTKTAKFHHINPILKYLYWLEIKNNSLAINLSTSYLLVLPSSIHIILFGLI